MGRLLVEGMWQDHLPAIIMNDFESVHVYLVIGTCYGADIFFMISWIDSSFASNFFLK